MRTNNITQQCQSSLRANLLFIPSQVPIHIEISIILLNDKTISKLYCFIGRSRQIFVKMCFLTFTENKYVQTSDVRTYKK